MQQKSIMYANLNNQLFLATWDEQHCDFVQWMDKPWPKQAQETINKSWSRIIYY